VIGSQQFSQKSTVRNIIGLQQIKDNIQTKPFCFLSYLHLLILSKEYMFLKLQRDIELKMTTGSKSIVPRHLKMSSASEIIQTLLELRSGKCRWLCACGHFIESKVTSGHLTESFLANPLKDIKTHLSRPDII
jgi:hypothetical protein